MCREEYNPRAILFDIQRGSMVDGPGLRTTVFIKGCPFRCAWCHNPEAMRHEPETFIDTRGNVRTCGTEYSVSEVMAIVRRDTHFYRSSGGGITISGGEPMASFPFARALASAARAEGIHTIIDTTGFGSTQQWSTILPHVDLLFLDYKVTDRQAHTRLIGTPQTMLVKNLRFLSRQNARIRLRCPIIPTVNDNDEHFRAICAVAREIRVLDGIDLLPYHGMGRTKYANLGLAVPPPYRTPNTEDKERWLSRMRHFGAADNCRIAK
jgi:pyruvate formate lyase activating enzyme